MLEIAGRLRNKEKLVKESLKGGISASSIVLCWKSHYKHYQFLTTEIGIFEERMACAMEKY